MGECLIRGRLDVCSVVAHEILGHDLALVAESRGSELVVVAASGGYKCNIKVKLVGVAEGLVVVSWVSKRYIRGRKTTKYTHNDGDGKDKSDKKIRGKVVTARRSPRKHKLGQSTR